MVTNLLGRELCNETNKASSRSHCIYIFSVQKEVANEKRVSTGKLVLVDLTGSETTDADGRALEEAKTIKKSLSALENMIDALISGQENHISRLLGSYRPLFFQTTLLCCCSPGLCHFPKTLCTLLFGARNSYDVILFLSLMTDEPISVFNSCLFTSCYCFTRIKALSDLHEILSSIKEKTEKLVHTNAELMRKNQKLKEIMRETYEKRCMHGRILEELWQGHGPDKFFGRSANFSHFDRNFLYILLV
ncbi:putative plus-end-directed kinesin ATPase [Helianthus anomalus]